MILLLKVISIVSYLIEPTFSNALQSSDRRVAYGQTPPQAAGIFRSQVALTIERTDSSGPRNYGRGSGTIISNQAVLTAGHNLRDNVLGNVTSIVIHYNGFSIGVASNETVTRGSWIIHPNIVRGVDVGIVYFNSPKPNLVIIPAERWDTTNGAMETERKTNMCGWGTNERNFIPPRIMCLQFGKVIRCGQNETRDYIW